MADEVKITMGKNIPPWPYGIGDWQEYVQDKGRDKSVKEDKAKGDVTGDVNLRVLQNLQRYYNINRGINMDEYKKQIVNECVGGELKELLAKLQEELDTETKRKNDIEFYFMRYAEEMVKSYNKKNDIKEKINKLNKKLEQQPETDAEDDDND